MPHVHIRHKAAGMDTKNKNVFSEIPGVVFLAELTRKFGNHPCDVEELVCVAIPHVYHPTLLGW